MSKMTATEIQIATIRARRVDDTARAMMADGVTLTHEQADDLGDETMSWLSSRLGLTVRETDSGVECVADLPTIELSSYDLGDVTAADYDAWVAYVCDHIDEACGFEVAVEQRRYGAAGPDKITADTPEIARSIREAVAAMWDAAEWGQEVAS
jgi:hypothetical protein